MTQHNTIHRGTAVITGASTGMGALYAGRLARMGYDLIIVARDHNRLNQLATHFTTDSGRSVEVVAADLTDAHQLAALEEKLRQDASITLLVNNAGTGPHTSLLQSSPQKMSAMIDLNVTALTGFARGERVTIPSLHDETLWNHYEQARQAMMPHLGSDTPAERYLSPLTH